MKKTLILFALILPACLVYAAPPQTPSSCTITTLSRRDQSPGPWIDQSNWLDPENLRFGLQATKGFMPLLMIKAPNAPQSLKPAPRPIDLQKLTATDPLDRETRDLAFLLDTRLYADGFIALRNGRVLAEQYWHGTTSAQARFLLGASRPLLSLLGAMALAQGKLAADRSVMRYVPALNAQTGLRKLSLQRLIDGNSRFVWEAREIAEWRAAAGWQAGDTNGLHVWLKQPDRWDRNFTDEAPRLAQIGPDAELLAWALTESYNAPLAQVFCTNLLTRLRPENPVFWATDPQGTEVADGLALSLRDFARFGQMLIEARNSGNRSKIPGWFVETLNTSGGQRKANASELIGLSRGSEARYGFIHLGGAPNRVALLGPHGNSLYIDFDRRLVIAIFAAYPRNDSPAMLATLEQIWEKVGEVGEVGKAGKLAAPKR